MVRFSVPEKVELRGETARKRRFSAQKSLRKRWKTEHGLYLSATFSGPRAAPPARFPARKLRGKCAEVAGSCAGGFAKTRGAARRPENLL